MDAGKLVLRNYKPGDDARIGEIVKRAWVDATLAKIIEDLYGRRGGKPWWRHKLDPVLALGKTKPGQLIVAKYDGEVVGYAMFLIDNETRIGQVQDNAVDPAFGGKGIGAAMHRQVLRELKEAGMEIAKVGTGSSDAFAAARRLYEKHGFKEVFVQKTYLRDLRDLET